jgi:hypothetical protein
MPAAKYLLFAGHTYYPSGGWYDYRGTYDTVEEAKGHFDNDWDDWAQIVKWGEKPVMVEQYVSMYETWDIPGGKEGWKPVEEEPANAHG